MELHATASVIPLPSTAHTPVRAAWTAIDLLSPCPTLHSVCPRKVKHTSHSTRACWRSPQYSSDANTTLAAIVTSARI